MPKAKKKEITEEERGKLGYDPDSPYADAPDWASDDTSKAKAEDVAVVEKPKRGRGRPRKRKKEDITVPTPAGISEEPEEVLSEDDFIGAVLGDVEEMDQPKQEVEDEVIEEDMETAQEEPVENIPEFKGPQFSGDVSDDDEYDYEDISDDDDEYVPEEPNEYIPEEPVEDDEGPYYPEEDEISYPDLSEYESDDIVMSALEDTGISEYNHFEQNNELQNNSEHNPQYNSPQEVNHGKQKMTVYIADDSPTFGTEITVPELPSLFDPSLKYKNITMSIRAYANDTYSVGEVKDAAWKTFVLLHYLLDAIMMHSDKIGQVQNYTQILSQDFLDQFADINANRLTKRPNGARVTVGTRYTIYPHQSSSAGFRIWVHEDTNPLQAFEWYMQQLELMIEAINAKQVLDGYANQGSQSIVPQQQQQATNISNVIVCQGDEDAQAAPPESVISYYGTRISYRQQGSSVIWSFFMPTKQNWSTGDLANSVGIYMYESNKNQHIFNQARQNGVLPPYIQDGEYMDCNIIVTVKKKLSAKGVVYYEIENMQLANPQYDPQG